MGTFHRHTDTRTSRLLDRIGPVGRFGENIGHPTSGSGGKKTVKRYLKSEQTHRRTHGRTDGQTDRRTFRLIESIGQEGRCFEKRLNILLNNVFFKHFSQFIQIIHTQLPLQAPCLVIFVHVQTAMTQ